MLAADAHEDKEDPLMQVTYWLHRSLRRHIMPHCA